MRPQFILVRHHGGHRVSAPARTDISFDGWLGQARLRACSDSRHQTTLLQLPVSAGVCRSAPPVLTAGLVVPNAIGVGNMHTTGAGRLVISGGPCQVWSRSQSHTLPAASCLNLLILKFMCGHRSCGRDEVHPIILFCHVLRSTSFNRSRSKGKHELCLHNSTCEERIHGA